MEVSKHHLIRLFSAHTGISPGKYLSLVRIFHAMRLLRSGQDTPLEIIAGACGYSCANYFAKAFKKQTGMTPSDYSKEFRREPDDSDDGLLLRKLYL
jgi:transcriptional regulator GlxA family with amidase domain